MRGKISDIIQHFPLTLTLSLMERGLKQSQNRGMFQNGTYHVPISDPST
jgi:hypothetical protein